MTFEYLFKKGIELFNQEKFFEAHEEIEKIWLKDKSEFRDFYKGIIQAAVAIHHLKKKNYSGAFGLYKSSTQYLRKYMPATLGVNVEKLITDLQKCFSLAAGDGHGNSCPSPGQLAEDLANLIPKIQLDRDFKNSK